MESQMWTDDTDYVIAASAEAARAAVIDTGEVPPEFVTEAHGWRALSPDDIVDPDGQTVAEALEAVARGDSVSPHDIIHEGDGSITHYWWSTEWE